MRRFCKGKPCDIPTQPVLLLCGSLWFLTPLSASSLTAPSLSWASHRSAFCSLPPSMGLPPPRTASLWACQNLSWVLGLSLLTPLLLHSLSSSMAEMISLYENCKNLISTVISLLNIKHVSAIVLCSPGSKFRSFKMQHAASLLPLSPNPSFPRFADSELHLQFPRLMTQVFLDTELRARAGAAVQPVTKSWQYCHC